MRIPRLHRGAARPSPAATPRRYRRMVLVSAGAIVLVLATTGIVAALTGGSTPSTQAHKRAAGAVSSDTKADAPTAQPSSNGQAAPRSAGTAASHSTKSSAAPIVLADGTYPAYIRGVDVGGATVTFDVIQLFEGDAAIKAAMEDGKSRSEAQYLYVYVRNRNDRLRTLPVAADVGIAFVGSCETPPNRKAALAELAKKTTPFTTLYYYEVTVTNGAIHHIAQRIAEPAC